MEDQNKKSQAANDQNIPNQQPGSGESVEEEKLEELQEQVGAAEQGDSVTEDIKKFKSITKQLGDKLSVAVKPHHEKAKGAHKRVKGAIKDTSSTVSMKVKQKTTGTGLPKWLPIAGGAVLVILVISLVGKIFITPGGGGAKATPTPTAAIEKRPTPTVVGPIFPYEASVYATDSALLKIEETNNILRNEMFTDDLEVVELVPPTLDYNVDF